VYQIWSMDFVADAFFNGNRFRILTIVDNYSKKCPGLLVDRQIKGIYVAKFLTHLIYAEGCVPERLQVDKGSEFFSKGVDRWAYEIR